jgi:hypothetical protein
MRLQARNVKERAFKTPPRLDLLLLTLIRTENIEIAWKKTAIIEPRFG